MKNKMRIIDADKFLSYLIFSKHIDELTCGEVKEAIEMCKVDIFDKIRAEMEQIKEAEYLIYGKGSWRFVDKCLDIIDKYKAESEDKPV